MLSSSELKLIARYISDATGIIYHEESFFQLEKRIAQFTVEKKIAQKDILPTLKKSKELSLGFLEAATNNESYFFRDPAVWTVFTDYLIDQILLNRAKNVKGLFVGCSRGQEIYSLTMLLHEKKDQFKNSKISLSAFDFNSTVLAQAQRGEYTQLEVSRGLDPVRTKKFFSLDTSPMGCFTFKKEFRLPCEFRTFNLLSDKFPLSEFDFIICRNVLIYQNDETKKNILTNIYESLQQHGVLLLGAAEKLLPSNIGSFKENSIGGINFYVK